MNLKIDNFGNKIVQNLSKFLPVILLAAVMVVVLISLRWMAPGVIYPVPPLNVGEIAPEYNEVRIPVPVIGKVTGWLHKNAVASDSTPVILYLHGNAENLETLKRSQQLAAFQQIKAHVLAIDFPGYGTSDGQSSESALVSAGKAAFEWLATEFPRNPKVIMGWSLGAGVALQVAAEEQPDGLIALSPWSSLPEAAADHYPRWVVGLVVDEKYNSIEAARSVKCPVLVIHGEQDELIPVDHSQRIAASLKGTVQYMRVFDAGHNDLFAQEEVWQQIHAFINTFRNSDFGKQPQE